MKTFILLLILSFVFNQPVENPWPRSEARENIVLEDNRILFSIDRIPIFLSFEPSQPERKIEDNNNCLTNHPYQNFFPNSKIGLLNFDTRSFCGIVKEKKDSLILTGFKEIKSRFKNHGFSIFATIKRKEYEFQFDTGYTGTFCIEYKKTIPFLKESHQTIEGVSNDFIYNDKWITINKLYYSSTITVSNRVKLSKVGMGFIKGFNWIVDTKQKKVYFKKNSIGLDTQRRIKPYAVQIKNNQLVICSKDTKAHMYKLEDVIIAINGEYVNAENICAMAKMLAVTQDWQTIKIEVVRTQ
jgi:hypothetical protein